MKNLVNDYAGEFFTIHDIVVARETINRNKTNLYL